MVPVTMVLSEKGVVRFARLGVLTAGAVDSVRAC
jgi:hypothetical protein